MPILPLKFPGDVLKKLFVKRAAVLRPFPEEQKTIDIGSYSTDSRLIRRELGWQPRVEFAEGIRRSIEYYRSELVYYLSPDDGKPSCALDGLPVTV